jgi:hypothetical protein
VIAPVTPETLTDEMIVDEFRLDGRPMIALKDAWFATSDEPEGPRKRDASQRICDVLNARRGQP